MGLLVRVISTWIEEGRGEDEGRGDEEREGGGRR